MLSNDKSKMIRLNFLPLRQQEFQFTIYRKEYAGEKREGKFADLYRNSLPKKESEDDEGLDVRRDYWISFKPIKDFEPFVCRQDYNHRLTCHFLFNALLQKTEQSTKREEYILPEKKISWKRIYFVLEKHPEGRGAVWLEPYYLSPVHKFGFLADFKFLKNPDVGFSRQVQVLSLSLDKDLKSNRNFYIDKHQKIQEFLKQYKEYIFPMSIANISVDILTELQDLRFQSLEVKKYVFADDKMDASQYRGVVNFGPLEGLRKNLILACILQKSDDHILSDLINALQGVSGSVAFEGMSRVFKVSFVNVIERVVVSDLSKDELKSAVQKICSLSKRHGESLVMPVFIGDKEDDASYYYLKFRLLEEGLPLQNVTRQLLRRKDGLKWAASNIALQIFTKLGGVPWKVVPSHERSLIFGIGQAHQEANGRIIRYFAYSVCTDSSGIYKKVDVLGRSDNEEDYLTQLRDNIGRVIRGHMGNGYSSFVLHIPFKIRLKEIEAIDASVKHVAGDKNNKDLDFVVLKVDSKNKFFGYAYTNSLVPYESSCVFLSNHPAEYIVWFEGLQYHRESIYKRVSGPIHIEFLWSSRELGERERLRYLQDVLNLSGTNWRGFNAKSLPISIYYCQLVAGFLKRFPKEVDSIDSIAAPWFL